MRILGQKSNEPSLTKLQLLGQEEIPSDLITWANKGPDPRRWQWALEHYHIEGTNAEWLSIIKQYSDYCYAKQFVYLVSSQIDFTSLSKNDILLIFCIAGNYIKIAQDILSNSKAEEWGFPTLENWAFKTFNT